MSLARTKTLTQHRPRKFYNLIFVCFSNIILLISLMACRIAGMKNPPRGQQPNMFNLLSWGEDANGRVFSSASDYHAQVKPKLVVEDRWQSESQYQFCQVGGKIKKNGSSKRSPTSGTPDLPAHVYFDHA
jgi:hypothetical protein